MRLQTARFVKRRIVFFAAVIAVALIGGTLFARYGVFRADAKVTQDDNTGQWSLTFSNNAGVAENNSAIINNATATVTVANGGQGNILTSIIQPVSFSQWGNLTVEGTWGNTADVKLQLYSCGSPSTLLPASVLPLSGRGDNSTGYTLSGGSLDISSLSSATYPCLQVRILLGNTNGGMAPVIRKLSASWQPKTVFLLRLNAPDTKQVGEKITYTVDYSVSYADDKGIVAWLPAPQPRTGTYNAAYNQALTTTFASASSNGQYTATATTINGVAIPANSVYWDIGAKTAGSTGSLSATFTTNNGWQNGVVFDAQAFMSSTRTAQVVSDSNAVVPGSQPVATKLTAKPVPTLAKNASGIVIDGVTHIAAYAPSNNRTTYSLTVKNDTSLSTTVETIFHPVVVDSLSDIFAKLSSSVCGNIADPASRISQISSNGVLDAAAKTITWNLQDMAPNSLRMLTFLVDYSGCADTTLIHNTAVFTADNITAINASKDVVMGVDASAHGVYAKGDRTAIAGGNAGITAGADNNTPLSNDLSDLAGKTTYNGTTTYLLLSQNTGAVRLDKTLMADKIPAGSTFVSATIPDSAGATIYYYTATDYNDPSVSPAFDVNNLGNPGSNWTTTVPADPSSVAWVAYYIPCLSPASVPAGGSCADKPSSVVGELTVRVLPPGPSNPISAVPCSSFDLNNIGLFRTYASSQSVADQSDANVADLATPLSMVDTGEQTHVVPQVATFKTSSSISGPDTLQPTQVGDYTISLKNNGEATAVGTTITIAIPTVSIGGTTTPVDFVDFSGAPYTKTLDANGKVTQLIVSAGDIPAGSSRSYDLKLAMPKGTMQDADITLTATITATDPNSCATINQSVSASTTMHGTPEVSVFKSRDESLIKSGGDIHYKLAFHSLGDISTTNTFIVDRIPQRSVFKEAYTNGTALDTNHNSYTCVGCKVYFSKGNPPLPANITPASPLTAAQIYANFSLGVETSPGVWQPPASMPASQVQYVAYLLDNGSLQTPQLVAGDTGVVGLAVTNDDDGSGPSTAGSAIGSSIYNYAGILSDQTLQAIGNSVNTTILGDPGLTLDKHTPEFRLVY